MTRKSILSIATAMLAGAAAATVTSTNTVCRIVLETTTQDNLISVPLVGCTTNEITGTGARIIATNFVMATGLPDDTALMYNDNVSFILWLVFC